ncbi:transglutaminase-like domain-containing protein [Microbacterium resistens]|uniref:transglutaminase-like domain-containing protein n=1 Tax=Microbacterium resistens TaxID=156977 RepID=UPI0036714F24
MSGAGATTRVGARGARGRGALPPTRRLVLDLVAVGLLLGVGIAGWWPSFGGPAFLPAAIGGAVLGLAIAVVCAWRRWGVLPAAGLTAAAYLVLGGPLALPQTMIAGVVPTLRTVQELVVGVVTAWKRLLTTVAPLSGADGHLLVPFLLALVAAVLAGTLALRRRRAGWALIPAGAHLLLVLALGTPEPVAPVVQGGVFAITAISWLALRQAPSGEGAAVPIASAADADEPGRGVLGSALRRRRLIAGAAVLALAGGVGAATAAVAAPTEPRHVFRDVVIPPFDVHQYPSPLQGFRGYVKDHREDTLFTVEGLPEGARVRLGTVDQYTGVVYDVSDRGVGSSGGFTPLRGNMSADAEGTPVTLRFSVQDYRGVWVPDAGAVRGIAYGGTRGEELRRSTYYNDATGTAVTTARLGEGDSYTVETILPRELSDEELADQGFGHVAMPKQSGVPDDVATLASEAVENAKTPIEQVRALETYFHEGGFFSHGLDGEVLSRAGHTAERLSTLLAGDQMIGDDEQYAALMALFARELGMPARVVMGFYPEEGKESGTFAATGDDVHAWVEVNFDRAGWVVFDPTPPEDQVPNEQTTKPKVNPKPQVLQPPPPPQEPVDLPPTLPDQREGEDGSSEILGIIGIILAVAGGVLLLLAILLAPFIVIGAWKAARRRKRRTAEAAADRISGGWDELADRAVDYGARIPAGATRAEEAEHVAHSLTLPAATVLADQADASVFGPTDPTPEDIDAFWGEVDEIVGGMGKQAGLRRRLAARLSLRSLLGGSRLSRGLGALRAAATERVRGRPGTIGGGAAARPGDAARDDGDSESETS